MEIIGNGCVVQRDKGKKKDCRHWTLRVNTNLGRKDKRFTGTYSQAKAALEKFKASLLITKSNITFKQHAENWYDRRVKMAVVAPESLKKDRQLLRKLIPKFGHIKLCEITPDIMVDGLLEIKEERGLCNTTMNGLFIKAKQILQEAYAFGLIQKNPMELIKPPRPDNSKRRSLSMKEFVRFFQLLSMLPIDCHTMALRLAVFAGLRRGEIAGLNWIDWSDPKFLKIERSYSSLGRLKTTKTPRGVRTVPLLAPLANDLGVWRETQRQQLISLGIAQTEQTPIITSCVGDRIHPDNLERWWRNNRNDYGFADIVLHEFRHTFLTMLGNNGATLNSMMSIAGWADPTMASIYVHQDRDADIKAVSSLDKFLEGSVKGDTFGDTFNDTFCAVRKVSQSIAEVEESAE